MESCLPGATELWRQGASRKRSAAATKGKSFDQLLREARKEVPTETREQIQLDTPRTFAALPETLRPSQKNDGTAQVAVERLLIASEWQHSNASNAGIGSTYTQGMNFIAAMCVMGFQDDSDKENEELAFWLLAMLIEDVLGLRFFAEWPPLLAYHAAADTLSELTASACPVLAGAMGEEFNDTVAMLSCKWLIPCFVGCLPAEPLVALWTQLVQPDPVFPQRHLYVWFLGLLQHLEPELIRALKDVGKGEPTGPLIFQAALRMATELPAGWRPIETGGVCPTSQELARSAGNAEHQLLAEAEDRHLMQRCGLSATLVQELHREFHQLATPRDDGEGITLQTLRNVLKRISKSPTSEESAEQLFHLLDRDSSESLDFFELMTGVMVLCEGSREKKLRLLFALYDTDGSGYLDQDELLCLAKSLVKMSAGVLGGMGHARQSQAYPNAMASKPTAGIPGHLRRSETWASPEERTAAEQFRTRLLILDTSGDGKLSWEEFRVGVHSIPQVVRCLAQVGVNITADTPSEALPTHLMSCWLTSLLCFHAPTTCCKKQ